MFNGIMLNSLDSTIILIVSILTIGTGTVLFSAAKSIESASQKRLKQFENFSEL